MQPAYIVKIDQNVFVQEPDEEDRRVLGRPDVFVVEDISRSPVAAGGLALVTPTKAQIVPAITADKDLFIEIRDAKDRKLITAVELLSPSNKEHGSTREQYLSKRNTYFKSGVHLVEIDLLRGGPRMPLAPKPSADYCVVVSRARTVPKRTFGQFVCADPLPMVPIPLRPGDGEAHLDLQAVLHRVYDAAGYANYIHRFSPDPPLSAEDREWAKEVVMGKPMEG